MIKRPHIIALGLVLLLALVVLNLPHNAANQLKLAIGSLFLPLFGVSKSAHQLAEKAGTRSSPAPNLSGETRISAAPICCCSRKSRAPTRSCAKTTGCGNSSTGKGKVPGKTGLDSPM